MIEPRLERFLVDHLPMRQVWPRGRDLHTHLTGTYALLARWGNAPDVCHAGLFHSIYGTWCVRHDAFPLDRRNVVQALIGLRAEQLVYVFCVTTRLQAFLGHKSGQVVELHDHHANHALLVPPDELRDLREIEAANLIEQGAMARITLRQLYETSISDAAKGEIERALSLSSPVKPCVQVRLRRVAGGVAS